MFRYSALLFASAVTLAVSGCSQDDASETPTAPEVPVAESITGDSSAGDATESVAGVRRKYTGISFDIPADWREDKSAQMIDSRYIIDRNGQELIIIMTAMRGGIRANIDRWITQVQTEPGDNPEPEMIDIAGLESVRIDLRGTYNNRVGTDQGVKRDWRFIGLAIPVEGSDFYLKLVGPREAIADYYDEFMEFVKTAQLED